jgi:hypothetical protein
MLRVIEDWLEARWCAIYRKMAIETFLFGPTRN